MGTRIEALAIRVTMWKVRQKALYEQHFTSGHYNASWVFPSRVGYLVENSRRKGIYQQNYVYIIALL